MSITIPDNLGPIPNRNLPLVSTLSRMRQPQSTALDFQKIHSEIVKGNLGNEKPRLEEAWRRRQWFEGNVKPFLEAMAVELGLRRDTAVTTNLYESWVDLLTKYLYAGTPKRMIPDNPAVSDYLAKIYSQSNIDAVLTDANKYALVGDVSAIQVLINEPVDEDETDALLALHAPAVSHKVWPADQFTVWTHPDNATLPWAVGVIDYYDQQRRLRVWTSSRIVTYVTAKFDHSQPWSGTAYTLLDEEENPLGFLPFCFCWWKPPTSDFWTKGPGELLCLRQEAITARLWKQNDDILYQRPILNGRNLRSDVQIPDRYQAGDMLKLFPIMDQLGDGPEPSIEYAYCDLSYLSLDREQIDWDLQMFADSIGIPEAAWRMSQNSAASGAAITAEQVPLLDAADRRQKANLVRLERDLALVTLMAANQYLGGDNPVLVEALSNREFDVAVNWGQPIHNRPGAEMDNHLRFKMDYGTASQALAISIEEGITLEQAREKLAEIQEDRLAEARMNAQITAAGQAPMPGADSGAVAGQPADMNEEGEADESGATTDG